MYSNMSKLCASICFLALLAGCKSTEEVQANLHSTWVGQSADQFFTKNGVPSAEYTKTDGGKIFQWTGGERSISYGGEVFTSTTRYGTNTTVMPSGTIDMKCSVQITTDAKNTIEQIKITKDSSGSASPSRCDEVFNKDR